MFEKEIMIAGLRKQSDLLKGLVIELEGKDLMEVQDFRYCEEVMRRIETALKKLRRADRIYSHYLD